MGSTANVTNVLYGTTWNDSTLLEKIKQQNLELERLDGVQRHFRYDCYEVAKYNPAYLTPLKPNDNDWVRIIRFFTLYTFYYRFKAVAVCDVLKLLVYQAQSCLSLSTIQIIPSVSSPQYCIRSFLIFCLSISVILLLNSYALPFCRGL
ncbi:MAG TPA: hypothetical protein VF318_00875 [Dehalococcoidales bacterium]